MNLIFNVGTIFYFSYSGASVCLSQNICQDRLHPVYETFHGDDHQNKPHQSHHHIISGFSKISKAALTRKG